MIWSLSKRCFIFCNVIWYCAADTGTGQTWRSNQKDTLTMSFRGSGKTIHANGRFKCGKCGKATTVTRTIRDESKTDHTSLTSHWFKSVSTNCLPVKSCAANSTCNWRKDVEREWDHAKLQWEEVKVDNSISNSQNLCILLSDSNYHDHLSIIFVT